MELEARIGDGTDHTVIHSCYRWFANDPRLMGAGAEVTLSPRPAPGTMGTLDVIQVVLSNTIALGALIVAAASWRATKPHAPRVRLKCHHVEVEIEGGPEDVGRILALLMPAETQRQDNETDRDREHDPEAAA